MDKSRLINTTIEEILSVPGVICVSLIGKDGELIFSQPEGFASEDKTAIIKSLLDFPEITELDLVYEDLRFFLRKVKDKYLIIAASHSSSMALIRLKVDLLTE